MHPAESWRLFVAITVPEAIRRQIESLQNSWRSVLPGTAVRWTKADQLHLTLKFLGDLETSRVNELIQALRHSAQSSAPMELAAQGAGVFPNLRCPRVLWVGIQDAEGVLPVLHQSIDAAVSGFGRSESSGPFAGHITLGRLRDDARFISSLVTDLVAKAGEKKFGQWTTRSIELFRSELSPEGARHTQVAELALGTPPARRLQ